LHPIIHLGGRETIVAVAAFEHPYDPALRARAKAGKLIEVGMNASANLERLVALRPDVVFTSAPYTYTGNSLISQLERYRVPVAATAAYLEATPLARAEWGLFFGAFYDALPAAREQFAAVEARYLRLKQAVAEHLAAGAKRPSVLTDAPWGDTWWVPGGASYMAQLIEDAGGTYIFDDNESLAGIPMSLESILRAGREADFWINPGAFSSMNALRDADPRMMRFDAFAAGQVYNNNRRLNPHGGNDIWERGIGQPDEILADLIAILHPEVLPDRDLVFYQRLE
jgi:iron complex transport system substrate-binding protein